MPVHDIVPKIVVTPPSEASETPPAKERGGVGRRSLRQRISLVTQDKGKEQMSLDFFSGTGSVTKVLQKEVFHFTSLNMNSTFDAVLRIDILDWDYQKYPKGYFEIVAASPPCTKFSRAKTVGVRNLEFALSFVKQTPEIIQYFSPERWWLGTTVWFIDKHFIDDWSSLYRRGFLPICRVWVPKAFKDFWKTKHHAASRCPL